MLTRCHVSGWLRGYDVETVFYGRHGHLMRATVMPLQLLERRCERGRVVGELQRQRVRVELADAPTGRSTKSSPRAGAACSATEQR